MYEVVTFTRDRLDEFETVFKQAESAGMRVFIFDGYEYGVNDYATELIKYMRGKFQMPWYHRLEFWPGCDLMAKKICSS